MRTRLLLLALLLLQACAAATVRQHGIIERPDWGFHFQEAGVEGTMVLLQESTGRMQVYNPSRARTGYLPASTFKIMNSLIALETGVAAGVDTIFPWDGEERAVRAWNRDLRLREAFAESSVPVYQRIARAIGEERMSRHVTESRYGNSDIRGGIDTFWLEGSLRISAMEQVALLRRLYREQLPFSKVPMDAVKDMMALDRGEGWVIRSKTGWAVRTEPAIGWWVGWLERSGEAWFFACNIDMTTIGQAGARKGVVMAVLKAEGALPQ